MVFLKGQRVTVLVPKIDRQGLQSARLPGVIIRVMENGYYEVMTSGGTIDRKFRVDEMAKYSGVITITNISQTMISLRTAAIFFNNDYKNAKIERKKKSACNTVSCQCKAGSCKGDKRCKCFAFGNRCNSHCHIISRKNCE